MEAANPQNAAAPQSDDVFRSLADPTRRKILQLLLCEELNVTQLVAILRQPQSTISRHLKMLREGELVRDSRIGTTVFYHATPQARPAGDVRAVLIAWLREQPLSPSLRERMNRALRQHGDDPLSFFERLGKRWDELRTAAFGEAFATEAFISLLPREWTVADIGTGTGYLLPILGEHFKQVIAVEPAAAMLEVARHRVSHTSLDNITFDRGDLGCLPIADASCDLAIACLVLHHVPDPAVALAEIARILKPAGQLLVIEQHAHEDQEFFDAMQDLWWGFDPDDLAEKVRIAGFDLRSRRDLTMPRAESREMEAPRLFVLTAGRAS